jgi:hypothetical protein
MMNKIKYRLISRAMKPFGIPANMSLKFYTKIVKDIKDDKDGSIKEKLWSYRRGFLRSSTIAFGLTQQNYGHYISDADYYRLYPLDKRFKHWIDDKLTLKYVLSQYDTYLPKYYSAIKKGGRITPLMDGKDIYNMEDLLDCIQREKQVALKMASSDHGVGFYKLSYNEQFEIDNMPVSKAQMVAFLNARDDYLVTEYVVAHESIRNISSGALNTVRVMVVKEDSRHAKLTNAVVKFSTSASGQVDNIQRGGIIAKVNVLSGEFSNAKKVVNNVFFDCERHPDSNQELKGVLPHWQEMSEKLVEISQHLAPLTYLGYDIAITDDGFKIIEINSHQGIRMFQVYGPLLRENIAADYFVKHLQNIKK